MVQQLPVTASTKYILLSTLTILFYDIVTHLDDESRSTSVKVIFIFCRHLPFVIGALRIPTDLAGAELDDENVCLTLLRSSIWLCLVLMSCVEFIFLLRTYALWGCSKRVLLILIAMYLAAFTTCVTFIQRNAESPIGESCYSGGDNPKSSTALLVVFVSLISHEIGSWHLALRNSNSLFSRRGSHRTV
ncbi:hypothetical protein AZE42_07284 [Rhizopogon vesiculosus]|uniref:DUF6533 domain-containing protein n=1 Tax=Rhizopogon vesiculosus TaxID=180088 RepID=A0A1J8QEA5_9AGAM|nr:hypothetical protein AZE42_07284 [Rhizopogon vesiculosus]